MLTSIDNGVVTAPSTAEAMFQHVGSKYTAKKQKRTFAATTKHQEKKRNEEQESKWRVVPEAHAGLPLLEEMGGHLLRLSKPRFLLAYLRWRKRRGHNGLHQVPEASNPGRAREGITTELARDHSGPSLCEQPGLRFP